MRFPRMIVLHNFPASKNVSCVYTRDSFQRRVANARGLHGSLIEGVSHHASRQNSCGIEYRGCLNLRRSGSQGKSVLIRL